MQLLLEIAADGCAGIQKVLEGEIKRALESRVAGGTRSLEEITAIPGIVVDLNVGR